MQFATPLVRGTLIRRYKRFLADVVLDDGREVTAHVANTGALMGLCTPGIEVWLEPSADPRRKLAWSWRLVRLDRPGRAPAWSGVDTSVPNRLVGSALAEGRVPGLEAYTEVRPETRYGRASRIDFLCRGPGLPDAYVEVKNVHLERTPGLAEFPDCVTTRGAKHLGELAAMVAEGHRAVMVYVIQRDDCDRLAMAADLDPGYARAYLAARRAGVEAVALACRLSPEGIALDRPVPIAE
ncbi:MAG: DNA/RNA nuclease SfsA [Paracoccaceae bacterium]